MLKMEYYCAIRMLGIALGDGKHQDKSYSQLLKCIKEMSLFNLCSTLKKILSVQVKPAYVRLTTFLQMTFYVTKRAFSPGASKRLRTWQMRKNYLCIL